MATEEKHITPYEVYGKVLIGLLVLTALTILAPTLHFTTATVLIALLIASVKGVIVLMYFMHLKTESLLLRSLVFGILGLYTAVLLVTFSDYIFR